jgi:hypothetical protein
VSTKLDEMWAALEAHQSQADEDGHGNSWRVMCRERTQATGWAAWRATPVGSAARAALLATAAVEAQAATDRYAKEAIDAIKREVKP